MNIQWQQWLKSTTIRRWSSEEQPQQQATPLLDSAAARLVKSGIAQVCPTGTYMTASAIVNSLSRTVSMA